ncbi:MAG: PH domain-containing protein [Propionibacteriaceae bacterium]|jgi:membrane protein YdbS with pleckstrin-like domain|nr:PH domain-containing protein [Propionibacteriaceae bacterium]
MADVESLTTSAPANPFDPPDVQWNKVQPQLATVRLVSLAIAAIPMAIICAVTCLLWSTIWAYLITGIIAAFFGWTAVLIPRRVKAMAYALRNRDLFYRSGILNRNLTIIPYVRIQYVDINVGPLERAFGLASVSVSTASPSLAATIAGLTPDIAAQMREILTDRENLTGHPVDKATLDDPQINPNIGQPPPAPSGFAGAVPSMFPPMGHHSPTPQYPGFPVQPGPPQGYPQMAQPQMIQPMQPSYPPPMGQPVQGNYPPADPGFQHPNPGYNLGFYDEAYAQSRSAHNDEGTPNPESSIGDKPQPQTPEATQ